MITPTIHINGDTEQTLTEQWLEVYDAAKALLEALQMSRPNGRNFYPQNERAIFIAQDEHRRREQAVLTIVGDATKMLQAIQAQGK